MYGFNVLIKRLTTCDCELTINGCSCVFKLTVDKLFRDAGVQSGGQVRYDDIIKVLLTPLPDY